MGDYDAIYRRKSIRKYSQDELPCGVLDEVKEICKYAKRLYDNIDLQIHIVEDGQRFQKILSGIVGGYGKVRAPHYIVATSEDKDGYLENAGFTLESVVLKLTAMGIGTCWVGSHIGKKLLERMVRIKENHIPVIVIAFGYPKEEAGIVKQIVRSRNRLDISQFAFGDMGNTWKYIMDAVKMSPSAVNGQPWRFYKNENTIDVYAVKKNGILKMMIGSLIRIDVGIALCHLYTAAQHFDKEIEIKKLSGKEKDNHIYIASIAENES